MELRGKRGERGNVRQTDRILKQTKMTTRFGSMTSAISSCTTKQTSETVEVITSEDDVNEESTTQQSADPKTTTDDQPQPSFLWRLSSGAVGGVYNAATGAAGMGYNGTKWVLGKGVDVAVASKDATGNVLSKTAAVGSGVVSYIPLPAKLKGKDKKE